MESSQFIKMDITASIIDYIGKYEGGIMVSVGLMFEGEYYDAMFYYTNTEMIINVDDEMKSVIGDIEKHKDYYSLMEFMINAVTPYEDMIETLSEMDYQDV